MTEAEFLAQLAQDCVLVGSPSHATNSAKTGPLQEKVVPTIQVGPAGTFTPGRNMRYTLLNAGKVAGPQTYAADEYSEDATFDEDGNLLTGTLLHSAGDPVMDDQDPPQQVVIPAEAAERVLPADYVATPVPATQRAVIYLETQKAIGTWFRYVEDDAGPKRPDLGFFAIRAWVDNGNGTVSEKRFLISEDDQGTASHSEIV